MMNRRNFTLGLTSAAFAGLALSACVSTRLASLQRPVRAYGPLEPDPAGLLDLPQGFNYRVISQLGERMSDGFVVPDRADGMGCFPIDKRRVALVRNHELQSKHLDVGAIRGAGSSALTVYDRAAAGEALPGGTTTIVYDMAANRVESQHLSLVGTIRNCAGGATPWGSWLSCEEDVSRAGSPGGKDHGWIFEVPATQRGLADPVPLTAMGRFNHEAAAVDPRTGVVYLTEDRDDSLFYRFLPDAKGQLARGGRLQALAMREVRHGDDSRNWSSAQMPRSIWLATRWIDLDGVDSPDDDLRKRGHANGATLFARGEGVHYGDGSVYFCCTSGGAAKLGQVMRYRPSPVEGQPGERDTPGALQIFVESDDPEMFNFGDNLTVAPNGHLIVCEDQYTAVVDNHLRGVTPKGDLYTFARLRAKTELAGACFSPDGSTLFVNAYSPAKTFAITGPWGSFVA